MGFRFYFFANDHEPIHVHIEKGGAEAKYDLLPKVSLVRNDGFKKSEIKIIEEAINDNKALIIDKWVEFFSNK